MSRTMRFSLATAVLALLLLLATRGPLAAASHSALLFDGFDDYVDAGNGLPLALESGFTLEAWIRLEVEDGVARRILSNRSTVSGEGGYAFNVDNRHLGMTTFFHWDYWASSHTLPLGQWTHVAVVFDSTFTAHFYVDGELVQSDPGPAAADVSLEPLLIGRNPDYPGIDVQAWQGGIDEVRVWSTEVDPATIEAWRNRPLEASHPDWANLEAYWQFDEGGGQVAGDSSGNGHDGRLGDTTGVDAADPTYRGGPTGFGVGPVRLVSLDQTGSGSGNGSSFWPEITPDGRWIAFESAANDLVPDDDNPSSDIFVRDLGAASTVLISRAVGGGGANGLSESALISADGRFVVFYSRGTDFVDLPDSNGSNDLFVFARNLVSGTTIRVSQRQDGTGANGSSFRPPVVSPNGLYVGFGTQATNLATPDNNGSQTDIFRMRLSDGFESGDLQAWSSATP